MGLTTSMFDYFAYCKKPLSNKVDEIYSNILRKKIENMKRNQNAEELTAQQINDDQMERQSRLTIFFKKTTAPAKQKLRIF